jgi:hypothetical protein
VGDGWYRCTVTFTSVATSADVRFQPSNVDGSAAQAIGQAVFIWGAQLEQRSSVTAYTPTTTQPITNYIPTLLSAPANVARFDHNPVSGESLGLLVEELRTNLVLRSEEFDNAAWAKVASSITANTIIAPDGTLTGDKLVEDTANTTHVAFTGASVTSGTTYTVSVFAKRAERSSFQFYFTGSNPSGNPFINFDLSTGTFSIGGSGATAQMTSVGNDFYRCSVTYTASATASQTILLLLTNSPTAARAATYTGDGYSGIYIWGAQLEAGAFPTSYIKTEASQVTRSADSASITGANFTSFYRQDEGTLYVEARRFANTTGSFMTLARSSSNFFDSINIRSDVNSYGQIVINNTVPAAVTSSAITNNIFAKASLGYAVDNINYVVDGGTAGIDTSSAVPQGIDILKIGRLGDTTLFMNGNIKKIAYYPQRLSNTQLQALTS